MNRPSVLISTVLLVCAGMAGAEEHKDDSGAAVVSPDQVVRGSLLDPRDKANYKTVRIGNQTWMAQNLNFETGMSWCYENDPDNCVTYGRLYAWKSAQKACPSGWHLPSEDEWRILEISVGGAETAGMNLKSGSGWISDGCGPDDYNFTALPTGFRLVGDKFGCMGSFAFFWTSKESGGGKAWCRYFTDKASIGGGKDDKTNGYGIRCLKD